MARVLDCKCEGCSLWEIVEDTTRQVVVGGRHAVQLRCVTCGVEYPATLVVEPNENVSYVNEEIFSEPPYFGGGAALDLASCIPPAPHSLITEPSTDPVPTTTTDAPPDVTLTTTTSTPATPGVFDPSDSTPSTIV